MGIVIFGLNGAGKSTLTHALANELNFYEMDVEDYYFPNQRESRSKVEVQEAILEDVKAHPNFILAGVSMNWCEEILSRIEFAFWVKAPLEKRLERIRYREEKRFGARAFPGGDMYEQQAEFRKVVASREEASLEECVKKLSCEVYILDGTLPVEYNIKKIKEIMHR